MEGGQGPWGRKGRGRGVRAGPENASGMTCGII